MSAGYLGILAETVALERLDAVPAFARLAGDTRAALIALGCVRGRTR